MNVITGLPRSGSTLLCNILNQNPNNYASNTSVLSAAVLGITTSISEQTESQEVDHKIIKQSINAFIGAWHNEGRVAFDKGRMWSQMGLIYKELGLGTMYVLVRDLRDVYASCEKQHQKNPLIHGSQFIASNNLYDRADAMFSNDGVIGSAVHGVEDLIRRKLDNVEFIKYETMVADPSRILATIDDFEYQFDDVKNVTPENDAKYQNKYPHTGEGKVSTKSIGMWQEYLDSGLAKNIQQRFPLFSETFGY